MSDEQLKELQRLREEIRQLQQRLDEINRRLEKISAQAASPLAQQIEPPPLPVPVAETAPTTTAAEEPPPFEAPPVIRAAETAVAATPDVPQESFEVRLGTYWLPRIGIAALLTGMVFFAAYITPRLTVPQKVAVGYLACAVLGGLGLWLEKRMPQFARILQAGSLALAYFVTYAAHFVEAFRVIYSPTLALTLLTLVVVAIVAVAQERQSATLAGMALFFGYYTSVISGVTGFTLASNAVLALAALFFLARNRWVHISYGAVLATYLTYMIWVWQLNRWGELDHLLWGSGYLAPGDFRLRAAFLSLYWLLFAVGGLILARDSLASAERSGLLTLNNLFFFLLFTLLMRHAYPESQWQFQFCFGGALLIASAIAYQRFAPERSVMDTLFVQGLLVATLGLMSYFKGVQLIAALALESVFILMLARWVRSKWVSAIGGLAFLIAYLRAWDGYPDQDYSAIYGALFVAAVGFACARLARWGAEEAAQKEVNRPALVFAFFSAILAMGVAREYFNAGTVAWAFTGGAIVVAIIGAALCTREVLWASHVPLLCAFGSFFLARFDLLDDRWTLAQSLALVAVTLGFGVFLRRRTDQAVRAEDSPPAAAPSAIVFVPYAFVATVAAVVATVDHAPERWLLSVLAVETLLLILAAGTVGEGTYAVLSLIPLATGTIDYLASGKASPGSWWANALVAVVLLCIAQRVAKMRGEAFRLSKELQRLIPALIVVAITALAVVTLRRLVAREFLTASWSVCGFALLALGFAAKERSYRVAGLIVLGLSLGRALLYDLARLEVVYRILSFIGLGVILLVLAFLYTKNREKIAKWL